MTIDQTGDAGIHQSPPNPFCWTFPRWICEVNSTVFGKKIPSAQGMTPHNSFEFCIFYSLQRRFAINFCATRCADSTTSHQSCRFATMPVVCFMQMLKCLGPFPRNTLLTWQDAAEQHNRQGMSIFPQDRMIPGTSKLNLRWPVKKRESQL